MFFMAPQQRHFPIQYQFQPQQNRSSSRNLGPARQLIGRQVKINRGGPDSVEGVLVAVNGDVLVLKSKGTIIYVNGAHVKSITEGKSQGKSGQGSGGRSEGAGDAIINASTITGVLSRMRQQFVQINRGGPEKLEGFLADLGDDFILLIVGREFVRVPIFHIKTVNFSGQSSDNNNRQNQNRSQSSGSGHSGGRNRTSGGRQNRTSGGRQNRTSGGNRNRSRR
jgi:spore coat protein B